MLVSEAVVVNLRPLTPIDEFPCRSLKFTPDTTDVCIGRASKRESKNLVPCKDNGLFDSRVMSRNHAQLIVRLDKKLAYLRDGGSMHGTYVNGKKLASEEEHPLSQGDLITFGTEVIRGKDTFPPVQVRCELDWLHKPTPTNTFCVPDDDDDNNVETDNAPVSVVEVSSPFTSPLKKDSPNITLYSSVNMLNNSDCAAHHGSQDSPINLDCDPAEQPLVTPRMTPPPAISTLDEEPSEGVAHLDVFVEETGLESSLESSPEGSSDWEEDDDDDDDDVSYGDEEEIHSQCSLDSDMEEDSCVFDDYKTMKTSQVLGIRDLIASDPSFDFEEAAHRLNSGVAEPRFDDEKGNEVSPILPKAIPSDLPVVERNSSESIPHNVKPSEIFPIQAPQPPNMLPLPLLCQQTQNRFLHNSLIGLQQNPLASPINWHPGSVYPLPVPALPKVTYSDGPFANELTAANSTATTCETTEPAIANAATAFPVSKDVEPSEQDIQKTAVVSEQRNTSQLPPSQSAIPPQDPGSNVQETRPLKRKAEAIEEPLTNPSREIQALDCGDNETGSLEAQPRKPSEKQDIVPRPLSDLVPANESTPAIQTLNVPTSSERPLKRAKKSAARGFASHAATAALGVAIGALGTIVTLASLPPDYFHE
ncbi:hypothetical protein ASPACDRAFT_64611 [Aspergillus aculeatus ATCC 16872]|uniref:FHA domain-containing protein n=1 Tax=Aspergillus aculeatus (strain ATCC 16872 / CBS 172.66 / WB 5094) TaxID=690307 RepID=A0A1L9WGV4_ASPA1|nr:uncharacterized protein ASPACDRAFT_64611 [Aspergillus aculeatus ATCC 16872]OJJ95345.1 hypothetical protein ASPACDRAFT_64611 [Aspergillus aculeatus ATCC 16872]